MTADGFLNRKQHHPLAMTAAIAINLAAVGAVMLAKNGYVVVPPGAIPIIDIYTPPPPDPVRPPDTPRAKTPERPVYTPPPKVPSGGTTEGTRIEGTTDFPTDAGTGGTGDGDAVVIPKVEPTPVPVPTDPVPLASSIRDFQPPYPPQLLRTGIEGKAVVRVLIGTDGRVKQVAIISADDPLFADATERQALRKWRFRPATRDGQATEAWKQMTVKFEIVS